MYFGDSPIRKRVSERVSDQTSLFFAVFLIFYLVQAFASLFFEGFPPVLDFSAAVALLLCGFFLHLLLGLDRAVPVFLGIALFFNILGLYSIVPYNGGYIGTLYGAPQLGFHYDWIVHSFGFGFFALAFSSIMYPYLIKALKSHYAVFLMLLLSMMGFGAINEINEYLGFTAFGIGEGFMEFGDGDASPYEGPWENSCMDLVNNFIGGAIFIGLFILFKSSGRRPSQSGLFQ